jgi:hypothetical protein
VSWTAQLKGTKTQSLVESDSPRQSAVPWPLDRQLEPHTRQITEKNIAKQLTKPLSLIRFRMAVAYRLFAPRAYEASQARRHFPR